MPIPTAGDLFADLQTNYAQFEAGDTDQALNAALEAVRNYCGWHIAPVLSETIRLRSPDRVVFFLPTRNLVTVESVTQLGETVDLGTMTAEVDGEVRRVLGYRYTFCNEPLTVTFTHGYEVLPSEVAQVVMSLTKRSLESPASGRSVTQVGQVQSTTYATHRGALPLFDEDMRVLDKYRTFPGIA